MRGSMTMHEMSTPSLPKLTDWLNKTAEQIVSNVHRCTHKTCRNHRQHSKKFLTKTYTTACGAITARKKTLRKRPNRHLRAGQSSQVKQNQTLRTLPPIPPIPPPMTSSSECPARLSTRTHLQCHACIYPPRALVNITATRGDDSAYRRG